jgi:hypothetical protein
MSQKIELQIEIDPEGNVQIKTHGLKGEECVVETESLERELGLVRERSRTSEYYAQTTQAHSRNRARR